MVLVRLANVSAASLEGGISVLNVGEYPGLLLTGFMISISLGLICAWRMRLCRGERCRLTLWRAADHEMGFNRCNLGREHSLSAAQKRSLLNKRSIGRIYEWASRMSPAVVLKPPVIALATFL